MLIDSNCEKYKRHVSGLWLMKYTDEWGSGILQSLFYSDQDINEMEPDEYIIYNYCPSCGEKL